MAIREKMRNRAAPLLQPGETVQVVFCAQTVSARSAWKIIISKGYRVVVVTNRRILVCRAGRLRPGNVKGVERELPRTTRLGEPNGLWWPCDSLGGRLYVHRRFHKDVRTADAELAGAPGAS